MRLTLTALIVLGSSTGVGASDHETDRGSGHVGKKRDSKPRGFLGFGLSYHLGYGYGGYGLGVGPDGGYPFYGGPGYPHEASPLNRCGKILPFAYLGEPGYTCDGLYRGFVPTGPLVVDTPIVTSTIDAREFSSSGDYGIFSGAIPYPERTFAPFTTDAATTGSPTGAPPARPNIPTPAIPSGAPPTTGESGKAPSLEIDDAPEVAADGIRGLRVSRTDAEGMAEMAGLRAGDVIRSINGLPTTERGHLTWIMANAAPDHLLRMSVRSAADGRERTVTLRYR